MGFNGANLRGLGVSSTLVLLNGRRMANFASPGDSAGVDLNSIPASAIQRVEVRPRVSGAVEKIHFTDGQMVKAGDLLFSLDDEQLKNAVEQLRVARVDLLAPGRKGRAHRGDAAAGDAHQRTSSHGYGYGMRLA